VLVGVFLSVGVEVEVRVEVEVDIEGDIVILMKTTILREDLIIIVFNI